MLVGRIEGEPNLRTVIQIKNNLAAFGHAKVFELSEGGLDWKCENGVVLVNDVTK
ncbi:hypothetical protein [Clostridium sp. KNHs205]|uniref:hypothetical protein n=1 Tax=Clostridium sp. KNHs205 TaxID=1449050 RepID=UPI000AB1B7B2